MRKAPFKVGDRVKVLKIIADHGSKEIDEFEYFPTIGKEGTVDFISAYADTCCVKLEGYDYWLPYLWKELEKVEC